MMAKRGRPKGSDTYTEAIADEIAERIGNGEPLAAVCRDEHMPALSTVYDWQNRYPEFSGRIARAREAGFDMIAQEALMIADTPVKAEELEYNADGIIVKKSVRDAVRHRALQIDTRLKLLAKWDPKRYGDKQQVEHSGKMTLEQLLDSTRGDEQSS